MLEKGRPNTILYTFADIATSTHMMHNKRPALLFRILILAATYGFITWKLSEVAGRWQEAGLNAVVRDPGLIAVVVAMMPFNWLLEAVRWKKLTGEVQTLSVQQSLRSVVAGITMGLFTPRRIGDVGGRCLMMEPGKRRQGLMAFGLGSLIQTAVTSFFGVLAMASLIAGSASLPENQSILLLAGSLVIFTLLMMWATHLTHFKNLLLKIPWLKNYPLVLSYFDNKPLSCQGKIFLLGVARYVVFASQFYLLIRAFGPSIPLWQGYTGIALTYFLMTFVPLSSLAGLGIRGSTSVFVFSLFTTQTGGIVVATLCLWIVNLALPALAGAWILGQAANWQWKKPLSRLVSKSYKSF